MTIVGTPAAASLAVDSTTSCSSVLRTVLPFELFGFIFKAHRLARQGDPAVNLEPMFFMLWRDFAHPSASGILDSRLPFKRRADLQKTIIDWLFVLVKQDFNRAKTLVNRFEQHAVILFRLAQ